MSLGYLDDSFSFRGKGNYLIGEWQQESQYEGIAYVPENDTFLLLHESLPVASPSSPSRGMTVDPTYKPHISTVKIKDDMSGYDILAQCSINFELSHENKVKKKAEVSVTSILSFLLYIYSFFLTLHLFFLSYSPKILCVSFCLVLHCILLINTYTQGFESIMYLNTLQGEQYLLGLCEGNFCVGGSQGRESGNGESGLIDAYIAYFWDIYRIMFSVF